MTDGSPDDWKINVSPIMPVAGAATFTWTISVDQVHNWHEDKLAPIPQEDGMALQPLKANVGPVTGMTPAAVAKELRSLIRDSIWRGLAEAQPITPSSQLYRERLGVNIGELNTQLVALEADLNHICELAKLRRPSEVRKYVEGMKLQGGSLGRLRRKREAMKTNFDRLGASKQSPVSQQKLRDAAERAYALVQALPTIDMAPVGKADNTLRAITAMVKVYWGLGVEKGPESLPDIVKMLMEQVATQKDGVPEEPVFEALPELPPLPEEIAPEGGGWEFHYSGGKFVDHDYQAVAKTHQENGGKGSMEDWNFGDCSGSDAKLAFEALHSVWPNAGPYWLKKGSLTYAELPQGLPIVWHINPETGDQPAHDIVTTPWQIWTMKQLGDNLITNPTTNTIHAHDADGEGSAANWNGGVCSWEDAQDALRAVRNRYSDPSFSLKKKGVDWNFGYAMKGAPIKWYPTAKEITFYTDEPVQWALMGHNGNKLTSIDFNDMKSDEQLLAHAHPLDGEGSLEHWNDGFCSYRHAQDALRRARARYSGPRYLLKQQNATWNYGIANKEQPITWFPVKTGSPLKTTTPIMPGGTPASV